MLIFPENKLISCKKTDYRELYIYEHFKIDLWFTKDKSHIQEAYIEFDNYKICFFYKDELEIIEQIQYKIPLIFSKHLEMICYENRNFVKTKNKNINKNSTIMKIELPKSFPDKSKTITIFHDFILYIQAGKKLFAKKIN